MLLQRRPQQQLERYRDDPDTVFDLPLLIEGSPLQRSVWDAMCAIPRGRTRTYGELARELGADARAIGQALRRQPPADRDPVPSRRRRRRHRRLLAHQRGIPDRGQALAARPRDPAGRVRAQALSPALLDAFCDALWLEDGLSKNTIGSYRADLLQLCAFPQEKELAAGRGSGSVRFPRFPKGKGDERGEDGFDAEALLPVLPARAAHQRRPDAQARPAEARAALSEDAVGGRRRGAARRAGHRRPTSACATARCWRRCTPPACASRSWSR